MMFTGTVSNKGNITLFNVFVVDNQPTNNTPVVGPLTLAPGETSDFSGSFLVPTNICDTNIADTVTARGTDVCLSNNVTATATAICPISPNPKLVVTKHCPPNPVAPGDLLIYTGTVSNAGGITITNIVVVDDRPTNNSPVASIASLAPGESIGYGGSYRAPYDCCGPCVDTVTATGKDTCTGSNVTATATVACPRVSTPAIRVSRDCPPSPVTAGDLVFFTGVVSNAGNATLGNVIVIDDQAGDVLDNVVLAPGEAVSYMGMYVPTNCGPSLPSGVTATGSDICTGIVVSNRFVTTCSVGCPQIEPVTIVGVRVDGTNFVFSFATEPDQTYRVQFTDSLSPINWHDLTTLPGDGTLATVTDSIANGQRFYRVWTY